MLTIAASVKTLSDALVQKAHFTAPPILRPEGEAALDVGASTCSLQLPAEWASLVARPKTAAHPHFGVNRFPAPHRVKTEGRGRTSSHFHRPPGSGITQSQNRNNQTQWGIGLPRRSPRRKMPGADFGRCPGAGRQRSR